VVAASLLVCVVSHYFRPWTRMVLQKVRKLCKCREEKVHGQIFVDADFISQAGVQ